MDPRRGTHMSTMEPDEKRLPAATGVTATNGSAPPLPTPGVVNGGKNPHHMKQNRMSRSTKLLVMLVMTFFFFVIEMVCGYVSHSMALIADSFHMLSDVIALAIAYGCLKIAQKNTIKNTFGWVRAEVLGALINGVFLLALCFTIFIESINRFLEPHPIKEPEKVLIVGVVGLLINLVGMIMFHAHSHGHHGVNAPMQDTIEGAESRHLINCHQDGAMALADLEAAEDSLMTNAASSNQRKFDKGSDQLNMRGVFLHVLSDAIGSVIVIATALVSWLLPGFDILKLYMDPFLSILLVILIVCTTFPLVRETALILMQTTPKFLELDEIKKELLKIDGVVAIHEFHVWRLVGERIIATVHIRFVSLRDYLMAAERIRSIFHDNHIHSATIQPEFTEMESSSAEMECAFACLPTNCPVSDTGVKCCPKVVDLRMTSTTAAALSKGSTSTPRSLIFQDGSAALEDALTAPVTLSTAQSSTAADSAPSVDTAVTDSAPSAVKADGALSITAVSTDDAVSAEDTTQPVDGQR